MSIGVILIFTKSVQRLLPIGRGYDIFSIRVNKAGINNFIILKSLFATTSKSVEIEVSAQHRRIFFAGVLFQAVDEFQHDVNLFGALKFFAIGTQMCVVNIEFTIFRNIQARQQNIPLHFKDLTSKFEFRSSGQPLNKAIEDFAAAQHCIRNT